jgi:hypothetical protein
VKPGVTGWAQIRDGYANSLEDFQDKLARALRWATARSAGRARGTRATFACGHCASDRGEFSAGA